MDKKWGGFGKSSRIKLVQGRKDRGRRHMMHLGDEALTLLWRMRWRSRPPGVPASASRRSEKLLSPRKASGGEGNIGE